MKLITSKKKQESETILQGTNSCILNHFCTFSKNSNKIAQNRLWEKSCRAHMCAGFVFLLLRVYTTARRYLPPSNANETTESVFPEPSKPHLQSSITPWSDELPPGPIGLGAPGCGLAPIDALARVPAFAQCSKGLCLRCRHVVWLAGLFSMWSSCCHESHFKWKLMDKRVQTNVRGRAHASQNEGGAHFSSYSMVESSLSHWPAPPARPFAVAKGTDAADRELSPRYDDVQDRDPLASHSVWHWQCKYEILKFFRKIITCAHIYPHILTLCFFYEARTPDR